MTGDNRTRQAMDWALGALAAEERATFSAAMSRDPRLWATADAFEESLASLAEQLPPEPLPPGLWARIEESLDAASAAIPGSVTVRSGEGDWVPVADGVQIKILSIDPVRRRRSLLLRMEPGARLPAHEHRDVEEALLLEGDISFGEASFAPGDYQCIPAGVHHIEAVSRQGCLAYISEGL
jgi:quercetin dioxygenase-like cupin family protein